MEINIILTTKRKTIDYLASQFLFDVMVSEDMKDGILLDYDDTLTQWLFYCCPVGWREQVREEIKRIASE